MIPEAKQAVVARALEAAFGVREPEAITPLVADDGLSQALAYRVEVAGRPYLLRLVKDDFPGIDPEREFAFVRVAAEAGVAPRVWYASVEDRVLVSDFVETRPLPADAAVGLARTIRRLHDVPLREPALKVMPSMDGLVQRFWAADLLAGERKDALRRLYDEVRAAYPRDEATFVPCHNDLKPQNILYDGARFWLVDWEAAFLNDRYHDLAMIGSFYAPDDAEAYLAAYFGQPADAEQRRRYHLMTQLLHVSYVAIFALVGARAGAVWQPGTAVPAFADFQRGIVSGEVDLGSGEAKLLYAQVHLERALS